jgi:hypothetical protein
MQFWPKREQLDAAAGGPLFFASSFGGHPSSVSATAASRMRMGGAYAREAYRAGRSLGRPAPSPIDRGLGRETCGLAAS